MVSTVIEGQSMATDKTADADSVAPLQKAVKKAVDDTVSGQIDFVRRFLATQTEAASDFLTTMQRLTRFNAMFKTVVQSGGRISIPEAEREALGIKEGDVVQVILFPLGKR